MRNKEALNYLIEFALNWLEDNNCDTETLDKASELLEEELEALSIIKQKWNLGHIQMKFDYKDPNDYKLWVLLNKILTRD